MAWGIKLPSGYNDFNDLTKIDEELTDLSDKLDLIKIKVDNWLSENIGAENNQTIDGATMSSCPLIHEPIINAYIIGNLKRRSKINFPSSNIEKIKDMIDIFGIEKDDEDGITVHLGRKGLPFTKHSSFRQEETNSMKILAYSIVKGEAKNIIYILQYFSEKISHDILQIKRNITVIREIITNNAEIQITAGFGNPGTDPRLIDPRAVLTLHYGDNTRKILVEHRIKTTELRSDASAARKLPRHTNKSFLDTNNLSPHIFIPSVSSIECNFVSIDSLKDLSKDIIEYYRIGGIKAELSVTEDKFLSLNSKLVSFSKGITQENRREILNSTKNYSFFQKILSFFNLQKIKN